MPENPNAQEEGRCLNDPDRTASSRVELQEALAEQVINSLPGPIYLFDEAGRFLRWNKSFSDATGYSDQEISQMNPLDVVHPHDRKLVAERIGKVFDVGVAEAQAFLLAKNGKATPFFFTGKRIEFEGRPCLIGMGIDMTERVQHEKERERLNDQLVQAQKMEAIGRLAGGVAHDLNNLLSPILGYAELLLMKPYEEEVWKQKIEAILHAGIRARDLVGQLLAFSRKQTLEFKPVNINHTLRNFEELLRRTLPEDIEIAYRLAEHLPPIIADMGQFEQIVINLAVNSAEAMPNGGKLTIETALADEDESPDGSRPIDHSGPYAMLAVSDTGIGMDKDTRDRVFEPFYSTKGERGTGLGLATVYSIVKQHGGNIWLDSEVGSGTTFKIFFPVSDQSHVERESPRKKLADLKGTETLLLAEDDTAVRVLAQTILEEQGYVVLVARNGHEALKILEKQDRSVDLLLTDVVMPGINGKELFIKASEICPDLKVLYMSGYTDDVIAHRGVLEEGLQFIQKPFSIQLLAAKVRKALDHS